MSQNEPTTVTAQAGAGPVSGLWSGRAREAALRLGGLALAILVGGADMLLHRRVERLRPRDMHLRRQARRDNQDR